MKVLRPLSLAAVCVLLIALAPTAPAADEATTPEARLIEAKAPALVSLKFVLQITMEMGGQVREVERNGTAFGVVVDAGGLVMVRASAFEARMAARGGRGGRGGRRGGDGGGSGPNITATPTNIRVSIPGQEKELVGMIGAKDSKSGLAFVLLKDMPATLKLTAADLTRVATPKIGQHLYGVARLGQGFDHAPYCDQVRILGKVTKPKALWLLQNSPSFLGLPLYTADGSMAGVYTVQSGVGEGGGSRPFLLPVDSVRKTVASAAKEAARIRKELAEAAEDAKAADR